MTLVTLQNAVDDFNGGVGEGLPASLLVDLDQRLDAVHDPWQQGLQIEVVQVAGVRIRPNRIERAMAAVQGFDQPGEMLTFFLDHLPQDGHIRGGGPGNEHAGLGQPREQAAAFGGVKLIEDVDGSRLLLVHDDVSFAPPVVPFAGTDQRGRFAFPGLTPLLIDFLPCGALSGHRPALTSLTPSLTGRQS